MFYKYVLFLKKGWNLVSFYVTDIDLELIKKNKNVLEIKSLNLSYNSKLPKNLNTLNNIDVNSGYWIKTDEETTLEVSGKINKKGTIIKMKKGWNLIGYPYRMKCNIKDLIKNSSIIEIKNSLESYNSIIPFNLNTLKNMNPNSGYWIRSSEDSDLELEYPFIYNYSDDNNDINGLVLLDDIIPEDLDNLYQKENFIIKTNDNTTTNFAWSRDNKNIDRNYINEVSNSLDELKFTIYYGLLNGTYKSVGIKFLSKFRVFNFNNGKIKVKPNQYDKDNKYLEIYFGDDESNRIFFNVNKKIILFGNKGSTLFIKNLLFSEYFFTEKVDKNKSMYLSDYFLEDIKLSQVIFQKNEYLLFSKITKSYDLLNKRLKINCITDTGAIIISIKENQSIDKTMLVDFIFENGDSITNQNILIISNKSFTIKNKNNTYKFILKWEGPVYLNNKFEANKFNLYHQYLYWFDLSTLKFKSITINNKEKLNTFKLIEQGKDYIIFEVTESNKVNRFYLLKDKLIQGSINCTVNYKNIGDKDFNHENKYFKCLPIHNNNSFKIDNISILLRWDGINGSEGYTLKNTSTERQRIIGLNLNTYEMISFPNITFKVHYDIGPTENSISLTEWNSYKNYLSTIKDLLSYALEYVELFNLKLPHQDKGFYRNGGDINYDIYIVNLNDSGSEGYTELHGNYEETSNPYDVSTFLALSSNLDYKWLKVVIFHELFHAIEGSYDWYDELWISEGLAVAFEYNLNDYNYLSPKHFIPDFFEQRYLANSYSGNLIMNSNKYINSVNSYNDRINGKISVQFSKLYSNNNKIPIDENLIENIVLKNKNNNSIKVDSYKIINYKGNKFLKLVFDSNRNFSNMGFFLYINSKLITDFSLAYPTRLYGNFAFCQYLIENYGQKEFFENVLDLTDKYDSYKLLDSLIRRFDYNSSFMEEICNFWVAVNIMTNDEVVEKKYRLSQANIWRNLFTYKNRILNVSHLQDDGIDIDYLEPTGTETIDVLFSSHKIGYFKISGNFDKDLIHVRAIVQYQNGEYNVIKINPLEGNFNLEVNYSVYDVKLVLVTDVDFPSNELINIKSTYTTERKLSVKEVSTVKLAIRVTK